MVMKNMFLILCVVAAITCDAQQTGKHIRATTSHGDSLPGPIIFYELTVDNTDLGSYAITMHIKNAPRTFLLAMVKHFEYDDRFWRFLKDLKFEMGESPGNIQRVDSALWKITVNKPDIVISYRIQLPVATEWRASWKPFLTANGGLVGGPHSFLYIVGQTQVPSHIHLNLPVNWTVATGLTPTTDNRIFYASSVYMLTDEPILIGKLSHWSFTVAGVPHSVACYPMPAAHPFDTVALVKAIEKITMQAVDVFGHFPYKDYTFLLADSSYGGLEHANSVSLGVNSAGLAESFKEILAETAHEYFHTWNLVRIRPFEYGDVTYTKTPLAKELWFSEGITMFYADLMLRRAGLPVYDDTRINHLEQLLSAYFNEPGNILISPEKVSQASNADPGMLGDYGGSPHVQGEVFGLIFDLIIRDASNNKKNLDDVMREMMNHYPDGKGFTNKDVENAIAKTCNCAVHDFFAQHIYGSKAPELNKYLKLIGLQSQIVWKNLLTDSGRPAADLRVYAWVNAAGKLLLGISNPNSAWGKAGLHTNDEIQKINNKPISAQREFFNWIGKQKMGDTVMLQIKRPAGTRSIKVVITGYQSATVRITELPNARDKQTRLRQAWLSSK
jgi:predicted metalloprotease with PDZ domain